MCFLAPAVAAAAAAGHGGDVRLLQCGSGQLSILQESRLSRSTLWRPSESHYSALPEEEGRLGLHRTTVLRQLAVPATERNTLRSTLRPQLAASLRAKIRATGRKSNCGAWRGLLLESAATLWRDTAQHDLRLEGVNYYFNLFMK